MKAPRPILFCLAFLLAAAPVLAYTIVLKDGSTIIAQSEPKIEGERAYIRLQNGTRTFIDASEIDLEASKKANVGDYGSALVVEGGEVRQLKRNDPAIKREKSGLADLITRGQAGQPRPQQKQGTNFGTRSGETRPQPTNPKTKAGFLDLMSHGRQPYTNLDISAEIQRTFRGQRVDQVQIYRGTKSSQPLIEVTANSEAAVFRALVVGASTLQQIRTRYPDQVSGLQMVLLTQALERAGQFVLEPSAAEELLTQQTDPARFFVKYVQF